MNGKYSNFWLAFVQIEPEDNFYFNELIEFEGEISEKYVGAWANLLIKADTINEAIELIPKGLKEKNFKVVYIDKVENVESLVDYKEIDVNVLNEVDWLQSTEFVFMISDKIFPYPK